jgi:hypothetical protein
MARLSLFSTSSHDTKIRRVIIARLRGYAEIGAKERRPQLGDQFLGGVTGVAPALAAEFAIKSGGMTSRVATLVRERRIK